MLLVCTWQFPPHLSAGDQHSAENEQYFDNPLPTCGAQISSTAPVCFLLVQSPTMHRPLPPPCFRQKKTLVYSVDGAARNGAWLLCNAVFPAQERARCCVGGRDEPRYGKRGAAFLRAHFPFAATAVLGRQCCNCLKSRSFWFHVFGIALAHTPWWRSPPQSTPLS